MSQAWGWSDNGGPSMELNPQVPRTQQLATTYVPYNAGSTLGTAPTQQAYYYNANNLPGTTTTPTEPVTAFHKCVIGWLVALSIAMAIGFILVIILFTQ